MVIIVERINVRCNSVAIDCVDHQNYFTKINCMFWEEGYKVHDMSFTYQELFLRTLMALIEDRQTC